MDDTETTRTLSGKTLSPGLGEGPLFIYRDVLDRFDEFYDIDAAQVEAEKERLNRALLRISNELGNLAERVEEEIDSELSGVFRAHLAMVQDPTLKTEVEKEISDEFVSAGSAVRTVFRRWERRFQAMGADIANQKSDDMRDLARRLVSALAGVHAHALADIPQGSVLVASRLLPSDTVFLARNTAAAALLEVGGKGSHASLFAREIGLPCIAGIPNLLDTVSEGSVALVDADEAQIILNPTEKQKASFHAKREQQTQINAKALERAQEPAVTPEGTRIAVLANVGDAEDTRLAVKNGADGIGLYRLEQVYLGRQKPPSTAELLKEMRETLEPATGLPIYVRLLDVGADKPLPFLEMSRESNPSLGNRGIRFLHKHPELLRTQLDALLQLSTDFDLHILVPMVTLPHDVEVVCRTLKELASKVSLPHMPKIGAMIETPAAALAAPDIMRHVEFLSFGTNDLTQYSFAADRENEAVDVYFDDTHDVIFRLIRIVRNDVPTIPLSVCGELAGRTEAITRLVECGITSVSVVPTLIPAIKEAVRSCGKAS